MKLILKSLKPLEEKTSSRARKNEPPLHSPHMFYYRGCSMGMKEPSSFVSQLRAPLYEALFWIFWNFSRNKALIIHVAFRL